MRSTPFECPRHAVRAAVLVLVCLLLTLACSKGGGGGAPPVVVDPPRPITVPIPSTPGLVPEFTIVNAATTPRLETVQVAIPFAFGTRRTLDVGVRGRRTAWRVLQRWPDDSIRVALAQFTEWLLPGERKTLRVDDRFVENGEFAPHPWVASAPLRFGAEVRDTFDVPYRAFADGGGEALHETALVRTRRYRTHHQAIATPNIGRDYLTSTFYVTDFRDVPVVVVDWVLGNDYLGVDTLPPPPADADPDLHPLGVVDVNLAAFLASGATRVLPYRPTTEAIETPTTMPDGLPAWPVLRQSYLDDGQTRRWRFLLSCVDPTAAAPQRANAELTAHAMRDQPLRPLASLASWRDSWAAGLLGGPCDPPTDAASRAAAELANWNAQNHFGTWGTRGDPARVTSAGAPRNGPCSTEFMHALQAQSQDHLVVLEQKAWAQAMRPYHLYGLQVGDEQDILLWDGVPIYPGSRDLSRESLGRRTLWANDPYPGHRTRRQGGSSRAHGFEHFAHEHWTTDLLFDYWTLTGDAWAQEELRQLGQSLKGLLRLRRYSTSATQAVRAEGHGMQGFVQCWLAGGGDDLRTYALRRLREIVLPSAPDHGSRALMFQGTFAGSGLPTPHRFYLPWQYGSLVYGYLAAARFFQQPDCLIAAERTIAAIEYAWVRDFLDPVFGQVANGLRYYCPVEHQGQAIPANHWDTTAGVGVRWGESPLGGANTYLLGAMYLLADQTADQALRLRALELANLLRQGPFTDADRWDKWRFLTPEVYTR
ncbi:MAG: hypothetical protein IPK26_09870 [Planctomycetes bacterium]|nr:hypothetical protein [Planctomycetota bacterium]